MVFSATDIPVQMPDAIGALIERIRGVSPETIVFDQEQIHSLTSLVDSSVANSHRYLDLVLDFDVKWKTAVFQGDSEYDEEIQVCIEAALKNWAHRTEALLSDLAGLQQTGFCPACLETLRPRIAEVRRMLTSDDEFFRGEELDDLARAAVEEDEAGHTIEFKVMGE